MMVVLFMLIGLIILAAGLAVGQVIGDVLKHRELNNMRAEFGLQTKPYTIRYNK